MKIFLSATSSPFKACREQLRSDLAALGHEIRVQEDFQTGTGSLLQRIQDYVAACDRVVVLVGDVHGAEASGDGVPVRTPPRSYTQWEYFFATGERLEGRPAEPKPMQLYFASERFAADNPAEEDAELTKRQRDFATLVTRSNRYRKPFDSLDQVCRWVLRDLSQIDANVPRLVDDETFWALGDVEDDLRRGAVPSDHAQELVRNHTPRKVREHWLHRVASWSHPRYAVDSRFTRLTLLLDQGRDAEQPRWQAQSESFDDLRGVLAKVTRLGHAPVLVLLGPPGSGKSTLLRRLEYDLAAEALRQEGFDERWTFFVPLSSHKASAGHVLPAPERWLTERWRGDFPQLPAFDEVSRSGRLTLLLDALNELPHVSREDYAGRVDLWRTFLVDLLRRAPSTRVVITCRSLDYSELLSTPELIVPQARIERLSDDQVRAFLVAYSPDHGDRLWQQLGGTAQLDLFRSPYYLRLLIDQAGAEGRMAEGRAALFTGFVRQALLREIQANHHLFRPGGLIDDRDRDRVSRHEWRTAFDLPTRGPLMRCVSALAFGLQERRQGSEVTQVRASLDECLELLGPDRPEEVLTAGVALQVLDDDRRRDEVAFVHQLLQEYFAARKLATDGVVDAVMGLARVAWREADLPPVVFTSDNEPLPPAPSTGWEETFVLAAPMVASADAFVSALKEVNLPLAGRCAAQPDVKVSGALRALLQQRLVERSRHPEADLRSRIAAARALGEVGDPRFERGRGPFGDYLLPPLVEIRPNSYPIGSDEHHEDERPTHQVQLQRFAIAAFPVTNAEWRLFMESGGYDDEQWWDTPAARSWRRGEGTSEGPKAQHRELRRSLQEAEGDRIGNLLKAGRITTGDAEEFTRLASMSDEEFESTLDGWYPPGRRTEPSQWNDPASNHPAQPVVGICWYEARAYCAWLTAQAGRGFRLPTEVEWEAAARGQQGRRFAWRGGFEIRRCNTFEGHVRGTTPIGVFPLGDTPDGLTDMTGNVWEWTSSAYLGYPYIVADGRENPERENVKRVVRGGSWRLTQGFARASCRFDLHPDLRYDHVGFRVVCVSPIR